MDMKRIRKGFAVLVTLALLFTFAPIVVRAENDSADPFAVFVPDETQNAARPFAAMSAAGGKKVLLIQDDLPWSSAANFTVLDIIGANYDVVSYSAAATADFYKYSVIITSNRQTSGVLEQLALMKGKFEQYVNDGGILIFGICYFESTVNYAIPGNVVTVWELDTNNRIADSSHPIVTGVLSDNVQLTDNRLYGGQCSHIYFQPSSFPAGTHVILQNTNNNPTLIEYPLGKGMVIASGLAWEHNYTFYANNGFSTIAMDSYFLYGSSLAGAPPESITIDTEEVTLFFGETHQLTATVLPEDAVLSAVRWESSNPAVATVSETGLVTAVAGGEAIITAKTGGGLSAVCTVTVLDKHTVTFKDWDGTVLKTEEVTHGTSAAPPDTPTRTGYTFTGWDVDFSNIISDLTVTALYEINKYTVTFVTYDGTAIKTQTVEHGSSAAPPDPPTRAGHIFIGWDVDFSNVISDLTVTALWVAYLALDAESGIVTLTASLKAGADLPAAEGAQLVLAVYNASGKMLTINFMSVSIGDTLVVKTLSAALPGGATARGFLWNAYSIPIIGAVGL